MHVCIENMFLDFQSKEQHPNKNIYRSHFNVFIMNVTGFFLLLTNTDGNIFSVIRSIGLLYIKEYV